MKRAQHFVFLAALRAAMRMPANRARPRRAFLLLIAMLLLSGCESIATHDAGKAPEKPIAVVPEQPAKDTSATTPKPAQVEPAESNLETERNALLENDLSFSRMSEEKGIAQAFYDFLAPEAISLSAGEPSIRGRDAIKVHLAAGPQGFFTWQPQAADIARSGDMGFTWGTAIFQSKGTDEKPGIAYSKYVTVWKKQKNGDWKVVLFSNSPSPPPTERRQ
jgi:ketosteroid isomerase-like protein